jgi:hypothetical protein
MPSRSSQQRAQLSELIRLGSEHWPVATVAERVGGKTALYQAVESDAHPSIFDLLFSYNARMHEEQGSEAPFRSPWLAALALSDAPRRCWKLLRQITLSVEDLDRCHQEANDANLSESTKAVIVQLIDHRRGWAPADPVPVATASPSRRPQGRGR